MDRHPKPLTAPPAQQQEQGQCRRQQPHPRHPPGAVPGLFYSQPLAPGGISQPGKHPRGRRKGLPHASASLPSLPPATRGPCCLPAKKGGNCHGCLLKPSVFLAEGWWPPRLPPQASQAPGTPQEGRQGTATEGCHLYWACWVAPKRDTPCMATGWERLEAGAGIFEGLKASKGAQAAAWSSLDWAKETAGWGRGAVSGPAHLAVPPAAASSAGSLVLPPAKSRRGRNV